MVGEHYDNIVGLIVMGVIFVSAVLIVPNISYVSLLYVDQQQLNNVALDAMKTMLLGTGNPTDWGSRDPFDQYDVMSFGLARTSSSSFYVLDPDKVQRLIEGNRIGYIEYSRARQLLGLQDYGFKLSFVPPLNVSVVNWKIQSNVLSFDVRASFQDTRPISNAIVDTAVIYSKSNTIQIIYPTRNTTNFFGMCNIKTTLSSGWLDVIAVLKITAGELATIVARYDDTAPTNIATINMVGDTISLTFNGTKPTGDKYVDNIIVSNSLAKLAFLYNGTSHVASGTDWLDYGTGSSFRTVWSRTFNGLQQNNPAAFIVNFWDDQAKRKVLILAEPHPLDSGSQRASSITWTNSPSINSGDSQWVNPTYAYANDANFTSCATKDKRRIYSGYGFSIDPSAEVSRVRVRLDVKAATDDEIKLEVSGNGGSSWLGTTYTSSPLTPTEQTIWVNVTGWTTWTPSNINNDNIQLRITQKKYGTDQDTTFLDWIAIEVAFSIPSFMSSRNIQFGGTFAGGSSAIVTLQRTVSILGLTHLAELTLWRE